MQSKKGDVQCVPDVEGLALFRQRKCMEQCVLGSSLAVTNRRLDGLRLVLRATGVIAVCQVIRLQVRKEECKV